MKRVTVFILIILLLALGGFFTSQMIFSNSEQDVSLSDPVKPATETSKVQPTVTPPEVNKSSGLKFEIGASTADVLTALGEPKDKGEFEGSYYLSYDTIIYYLDSQDAKSSKVIAIYLLPEQEIYGVKVGMTPAEIKAVLGGPVYEGKSEEEDTWNMIYQRDENTLYFSSKDGNAPTESVLIKKEEQ